MGSPCGALSVRLGLCRGPLQVPAWELPAAEAREALPAGPTLRSGLLSSTATSPLGSKLEVTLYLVGSPATSLVHPGGGAVDGGEGWRRKGSFLTLTLAEASGGPSLAPAPRCTQAQPRQQCRGAPGWACPSSAQARTQEERPPGGSILTCQPCVSRLSLTRDACVLQR